MYNPDSMLYSLIMIFVYSKVMDYVSTIFNQRKMVLIISTQHAAIREDILTHLHRGATLLSGSGGFTGEQRPRAVDRRAKLSDPAVGRAHFPA